MRKVMIVGGQVSFIQGSLSRHLKNHGIEIGWHASSKDGGRPYAGLPPGCEGVIVITNVANHSIHDKAVADSKARGLPLARVCSRWAKALPILRMTGILGPADNGDVKPPGEDVVAASALSYVVQARGDGRIPKKAETRAAIQRAFGKNVKLSKASLDRVYNEAAAKAPIPPKIDPHELSSTIRTWTLELVKDDPRLALNPEDVVRWVLGNTKWGEHPTAVRNAVEAKIEEIRRRWRGGKGNKRNYKFTREFRDKWIKDWFQRAMEGKDDWPAFKLVRERCRELFGHLPDWNTVRPLRAEVIGDWALDLTTWAKVQREADKKYGPEYDILTLLESGDLKGIHIRKRGKGDHVWMTSLLAVDQYVEDLTRDLADELVLSGPSTDKEPEPESPVVADPALEGDPLDVPTTVQVSDLVTLMSSLEDSLLRQVSRLLKPVLADLKTVAANQVALTSQIGTVKSDIKRVTGVASEAKKTVEGLAAVVGVFKEEDGSTCTLSEQVEHAADEVVEVIQGDLQHQAKGLQEEVALNGRKLQKVWEMAGQVEAVQGVQTELARRVADIQTQVKGIGDRLDVAAAQVNPLARILGEAGMGKISVQMELSPPPEPEKGS